MNPFPTDLFDGGLLEVHGTLVDALGELDLDELRQEHVRVERDREVGSHVLGCNDELANARDELEAVDGRKDVGADELTHLEVIQAELLVTLERDGAFRRCVSGEVFHDPGLHRRIGPRAR